MKKKMNAAITEKEMRARLDSISYQVGINQERINCSIFTGAPEENYEDRLNRYLQSADYYAEEEFDRLTDGFGSTQSFRQYLGEYIRDFVPAAFDENGGRQLLLSREGKFRIINTRSGEKEKLNAVEELNFRLLCFEKINEFWREAAKLRTLWVPELPVYVLAYRNYDAKIIKCLGDNFDTIFFE